MSEQPDSRRQVMLANQNSSIVVTLDADFHTLLAISGVTGPAVIRVRIEGLGGEELARLLVTVLKVCKDDLNKQRSDDLCD